MTKLITITLLALSLSTFAQTLKTYTGDYPMSFPFIGQNGKAIYKYYDDTITYSRVKNGPFNFNLKGTGDYSAMELIVTGNYKNNLKTGTWVVKLISKDFFDDGKYTNATEVTTANYTDGILSGNFTYTTSSTTRKKVYNSTTRKLEFGVPTLPKTEKLVATFRKDKNKVEPNTTGNILVGNFSYSASDPNTNSSLTLNAKLDSLGFFIGKYTINDSETERIFEFLEGSILDKMIARDMKSGEAKISGPYDGAIVPIWKKFVLFGKSNPDSIKVLNESYNIRYRNLSARFNNNNYDLGYFKIKNILEQHLFCQDFKGDINYVGSTYNFDGFRFRQIDKK